MWINQPSTLQDDHEHHGRNVLAHFERDTRMGPLYRVYWLDGPVISSEMLKLSLSEGWNTHAKRIRDRRTLTLCPKCATENPLDPDGTRRRGDFCRNCGMRLWQEVPYGADEGASKLDQSSGAEAQPIQLTDSLTETTTLWTCSWCSVGNSTAEGAERKCRCCGTRQ